MTKSVRACLTEKYVAGIETGGGDQTLHLDQDLKGFMVVASGRTTSKSYAVQREISGRTCRKTIAATNAISLRDAREAAKRLIVEMQAGVDPKSKMRTKTVSDALALYLKSNRKLRPKSVEGYRAAIDLLNGWKHRPLGSITREQVEQKHTDIARRIARNGRYSGEASANAAMRALRAIWNFAADRDETLGPNPVRLKKMWFDIPPREVFIEDRDKPAFYEAVCELPNPVQRGYILFLLFTGARREEAASLKWADVDFNARTFTFPQTKTKPLTLPITSQVEAILRDLAEIRMNDFVFPADSRSGHIAEPKYPLSIVAKATGISVNAHALRHTYVSVASLTSVPDAIQKTLVNHADRSVHGGYRHLQVENLRAPAQEIASRMTALCVPSTANVLKFNGKR